MTHYDGSRRRNDQYQFVIGLETFTIGNAKTPVCYSFINSCWGECEYVLMIIRLGNLCLEFTTLIPMADLQASCCSLEDFRLFFCEFIFTGYSGDQLPQVLKYMMQTWKLKGEIFKKIRKWTLTHGSSLLERNRKKKFYIFRKKKTT